MSTEIKEQLKELVEQHVESQLHLHFASIAEEFDVESGDITPYQSFTLSKINDLLTELSVEYIIQNKGVMPVNN